MYVIAPGVCDISLSCLGFAPLLPSPVLCVHGFYPLTVFTHVSPLFPTLKYP